MLSGASFGRLEQAMKAAELRQQVIANNVANADTPYFKRSDVVFEDLLEGVIGSSTRTNLPLKKTNPRHMDIHGELAALGAGPSPRIVTDEHSVMNNNVNNVDIDREMALLAKNQLRYNVMVQQVNHDVKMMRTAIDGRG
ncbi:flagellar basal body rod protein FlgB [Paenibacillus sabuli]